MSKCGKCNQEIDGGTVITAMDKKWHKACFTCESCKNEIGSSSFNVQDGQPICGDCFKSKFAAKCGGCHKVIDAGIQYVTYNDKTYHQECFTCAHCKESLAGKKFVIKGNEYFCTSHPK